MSKTRILEEYRGYQLLSALNKGKFKGRVWKDNDSLVEIEGESVKDIQAQLYDYVNQRIDDIAESRTSAPESPEYAKALAAILQDLPDSHIAMLKAHYRAPNQEITATQLAEAAGYKSYSAANLQYGMVGRKLNEELPIVLPKRDDGTLSYTYALATAGDHRTGDDEAHWVWKLRPEVAYAIEQLGVSA